MTLRTKILAEKIDDEAGYFDRAAHHTQSADRRVKFDAIREGLSIAAEMIRTFGDSDITNDEALKYADEK